MDMDTDAQVTLVSLMDPWRSWRAAQEVEPAGERACRAECCAVVRAGGFATLRG
jgi:hypothetical protein